MREWETQTGRDGTFPENALKIRQKDNKFQASLGYIEKTLTFLYMVNSVDFAPKTKIWDVAP